MISRLVIKLLQLLLDLIRVLDCISYNLLGIRSRTFSVLCLGGKNLFLRIFLDEAFLHLLNLQLALGFLTRVDSWLEFSFFDGVLILLLDDFFVNLTQSFLIRINHFLISWHFHLINIFTNLILIVHRVHHYPLLFGNTLPWFIHSFHVAIIHIFISNLHCFPLDLCFFLIAISFRHCFLVLFLKDRLGFKLGVDRFTKLFLYLFLEDLLFKSRLVYGLLHGICTGFHGGLGINSFLCCLELFYLLGTLDFYDLCRRCYLGSGPLFFSLNDESLVFMVEFSQAAWGDFHHL